MSELSLISYDHGRCALCRRLATCMLTPSTWDARGACPRCCALIRSVLDQREARTDAAAKLVTEDTT